METFVKNTRGVTIHQTMMHHNIERLDSLKSTIDNYRW